MSDADGIPALIEQPAPRKYATAPGRCTVRPQRLSDVLNRALDHELILCCAACLTIRDALDRRGSRSLLAPNARCDLFQSIRKSIVGAYATPIPGGPQSAFRSEVGRIRRIYSSPSERAAIRHRALTSSKARSAAIGGLSCSAGTCDGPAVLAKRRSRKSVPISRLRSGNGIPTVTCPENAHPRNSPTPKRSDSLRTNRVRSASAPPRGMQTRLIRCGVAEGYP